MNTINYDIPILFIVFNRLETTRIVFDTIKNIKPNRLYIASDGPRRNIIDDNIKCNSVIGYIENNINWQCDVKWLKRKENLGCGLAVSSAINWFFDHEEMGIILEDDCVPHPFFFIFCQELLIKYKNNSHISHINGFNCQNNIKRGNYSYYFSKYFHVWGWATWRRAWKNYSYNLKNYNDFVKERVLYTIYEDPYIEEHWLYNFNQIVFNTINTWDYQWVYSNLILDSLAITPNFNLVQNIGMNTDSTHKFSKKAKPILFSENIPNHLVHPYFIVFNKTADIYTYKHHVGIRSFFKIKYFLKSILRKINLWKKYDT